MGTIPTEQPATSETPKVSRADRAAYEQSVFDGTCDNAVLFRARRIRAERETDRRTYESRLNACETLRDLPKQEAKLAGIRHALREAESFAASPLAPDVTVAGLEAMIRKAIPEFQVTRPVDLVAGLQRFLDVSPAGYIGRLKSTLIKAEGGIRDNRARAEQILAQTAGAGEWPSRAMARVAAKIEAVQARMASRQEILAAESKADALRRECEQLARGEHPSTGTTHFSGISEPLSPLVAAYRAARKRLDALLDMVALKPSAEESQRADEAELATLQVKAADARQAAIERLADPKNMKWVGDDE